MDILLKAGNGSAKLDHLLTHRKLDNRYEYVMQEWDKTRIVGNTELEKLKNKVKVKLIYLNIKSALRDTLGENASVDQEIDREIIRKIIEQKR